MSELKKARKKRLLARLRERRDAPHGDRATTALARDTGIGRSVAHALLCELEKERIVLGFMHVLDRRAVKVWSLR